MHQRIKIDKLVKVKDRFYLESRYPKPFSGIAYDIFPNNSTKFYWKIKNGQVHQFIQYSINGFIVNEENFNAKGVYDGKYFVGNDRRDTFFIGIYQSGKKTGKWIITNSDSTRTRIDYK